MGTAIEHPVPGWVKPVVCNFWHPGPLRVPGYQKLQMTSLTWTGIGCSIAVRIWQWSLPKG